MLNKNNLYGWKQQDLALMPDYTEYRPVTKTQAILTTIGIILFVLIIGLIA